MVQKNILGKWNLAGTVSRVAHKHTYTTNICHKISRTEEILTQLNLNSLSIMAKINDLSIKTAEFLETKLGHLGEIGIDFGLDDKANLWIFEVNGKPTKGFFREAFSTQIVEDFFTTPIQYACYFHLQKENI
ncbi:YheC/YheD family protein [Herbivorax sp. ANBcel31]|nr:YheC/YheD family protein [Herbivorax sp. ANBcel31]MDQ2087891.1 YheC/YheD family protein [Herbivorax sp. ANBcel31]